MSQDSQYKEPEAGCTWSVAWQGKVKGRGAVKSTWITVEVFSYIKRGEGLVSRGDVTNITVGGNILNKGQYVGVF